MTSSSGARPGLTLAAVALVQFMVSLDLSVVNVGLPQIAAGLGFGAVGLTWVIHAYALTFGGLLLLGGKAADRYGRKRILLLGLGLFGLSSLLGGFAQEPGHLVAARAAQGVGAAALAPAALALLTATFPAGRARIKAFGAWSAANAAGGALGVLMGGVLTEYANWRWVMFVNVPMAACALALAWRGIAGGPPTARGGRPDVLGAVLVTAGMTLLVFGVVRTDRYAWTSPVTLTTLAVAAALLAAFVRVELTTSREPLIRLGLFANRSVAGANASVLLIGAAMTSAFYFVSLYLQQVLGTGPARTGMMFLPFALALVAGSVLAVKLGYRLAPRTLVVTGGLLAAAGLAWFGLISPDGGFTTDVLGPSLLTGSGFGLCLGPVVSLATAGVAPHESGAAAGLLNSSRQIGASLGLAVLGAAAHHRTGGTVTPGTLNDGYALGLTLGAALVIAAVLVALAVLRRTGPPPRAGQSDAEGAAGADAAGAQDAGANVAGLLRPYYARFAAVVTLQVIGALAGLMPLLAVAELGRTLLAPGPVDHGHVRTVVVAGAAGLFLRLLFTAASSGIGHVVDGQVQLTFRRQLAAQLGRVPIGWFSRRRTGELAKVVGEDVSAVHPFIAHTPGELVSAFVVPLASLIYLFTVDWRLTLITLIPVVLAVALVPLMMTPTRLREQEDFDAAMGRISSSVVEFVQGISVVKAFGGSGRAHRGFRTAVDDFVGSFLRMVRGLAGIAAGMQVALSPPFVLLAVLIGGTALITTGGMAPADLLPFLLLGLGLTAPVAALGHGFDDVQAARRAVGRIRKVLTVRSLPEPAHPVAPQGHRLELRDVRFGYEADHEVLRGVDLVLEPGTTTALVGPSGSGKSTLVQLLPRFFDPTHGSVTLGGVDLRELGSRELYQNVSFVFQDVRLLRASVADNIALAVPHADLDDVVRAARLANVHDRILELPRGYESVIGEDAGLSGGEAQRIALARALLADTPVLVLDEATAFADPQTERAVRRALATLGGDRTILVVAHRPETIADADTVVMLDDGVVVERGTPAELLARHGRFAAFWQARRSAFADRTEAHSGVPQGGGPR
ncbi:MFS transporter [Streptomyces sp. NPDC059496]|uniref:MFS transporter n=1 Tax=Streptomyces sp. NPDC059496 TaxID=3346851 RepID=UPI003699835B